MRVSRSTIKRATLCCLLSAIAIGLLVFLGGDAYLLRFLAARLPAPDTACYRNIKESPCLLDRNGELLYAFLAEDEQWRFPVSLERISPLLVQATFAVEDKRFYEHSGVDSRAVFRAVWTNLKAGRFVSGASTLTMQLVKQHAPTPRTLFGKANQALMALRLDGALTKEEILAAYLNNGPYGGNLVGVEAVETRNWTASPTSSVPSTSSSATSRGRMPTRSAGSSPRRSRPRSPPTGPTRTP